MTTEAVIRQWGSSVGVVLPKEMAERQQLKSGDKVLLTVVKEADLSDFRSPVKRKMSGQAFKDMVRKGWE